MVKLYDSSTGQFFGKISEEDLQFLSDNLEEESLSDTDYYFDRATLDLLKEKGMSEDLTKLLESAMEGGDEIEIRFEQDKIND